MHGKFLIRVQSVSDIITNSSSEVFLCHNNTGMTMQQLKEFIFSYHESVEYKGDWNDWEKMSQAEKENYDTSGGMGGFLEIYSYKELDDDYWLKKHIKHKYDDPENYLIVDTDWCHRATIKWITENLNAIIDELL